MELTGWRLRGSSISRGMESCFLSAREIVGLRHGQRIGSCPLKLKNCRHLGETKLP